MRDLIHEIRDLAEAGAPAVVATVVSTRGSTPGKESMKLVVREDGSMLGTIGGGCVEADVRDAAMRLLAGEPASLLSFDLTEAGRTGLLCGGRVEIFLQRPGPPGPWAAAAALRDRGARGAAVTRLTGSDEPGRTAVVGEDPAGSTGDAELARAAKALVAEALATDGPRRGVIELRGTEHEVFVEPLAQPTLWIFGGGHVSLDLAHTAAACGFRVGIVDDREEFACRERFPMAFATIAGRFPDVLETVPAGPDDCVTIVTRGHHEDETVLRWAVGRRLRSVGMIGSRRKIRTAFDRLREEGVPEEALERVRAPVGLDVGALTSPEIAVAIAAELIAIRRRGPETRDVGRPLRDVRGA